MDGEETVSDIQEFDPISSEIETVESQPEPEPETQEQKNGNGRHPAATIQRTEVITHTAKPYVKPVQRRVNLPVQTAVKDSTAREIIQAICDLPESIDWEFKVVRTPGTYIGNVPVKHGYLSTYEVMPATILQDVLQNEWGGGNYKVVACDKSAHDPILNHPRVRAAFMSVDPDIYPPKNIRNAPEAVAAVPVPESAEDKDEELDEKKKSIKREMEEERLNNQRAKTLTSKAKALQAEMDIRNIMNPPQEKNNEFEILRTQMENDRRAAEERARVDRETFMKGLETLAKAIADMAKTPPPPPPVDRTPEMLQQMQKSQTDLLTALLPALMHKDPPPPPKDNTFEMIKMMSETSARTMEAIAKNGQREATTEQKLVQTLTSQLIAVATSPKTTGQFTPKEIFDMMKSTRKETMDMLQVMRGSDEEPAEAGAWDPKKGIAANIFTMLQGIAATAVGTPGGQALLMKLFGKTDPTDQDLMRTAEIAEAEESQRLMMQAQPQLAGPMPPMQQQVRPQVRPQHQPGVVRTQRPPVQQQQRPLITPAATDMRIPGVPIPPQRAPIVTPPPAALAPITPPAQTPAQQQADAVQAQLDAQRAAERQNVQAQLEEDISGVDVGTVQQQTNGAVSDVSQDSVTAAAMKEEPEEPEEPTPSAEPAQQQEPTPVPALPVPGLDESEIRLRARITDAMLIATDNVRDEIAEHEWPEMALGSWNGKFLTFLAQASSDDDRFKLIGSRCEPTVWHNLIHTLENSRAEPPQWNAIFEGVRYIVAAKKGLVPAQ